MKTFIKGIVIGLGAIAPGLSGSVLLVIFGLYQKTTTAISTIFKDFKNNMKFLVPLGLGIVLGVVLFSKMVNFLLDNFQMQTCFAFLGLILGSIPLFYKEVKKEGFNKRYFIPIAMAFLAGTVVFNFNKDLFPEVTDPSFFQSVLLGLVVATSYIVPGIDSAAILSALGLYKLWVESLAELDFEVLLPAAIGLCIGVLVVSFIINKLISKHYTMTFSIIFGLFLSIIPSVLRPEDGGSLQIGLNSVTYISVAIAVVCFVLSLLFSNLEKLKK